MKKGKWIIAIMVLICSVSLFAQGSGEASDSGKTTITVFHYMTQNSKQAGLEAVEAEFMALHPEVEFENIVYSQGTDYFPQLTTAINSGDVPEIIMGNPSLYPELIENGIVMDITGDSAIEELGLSAADLGDCSFQGKVYAYPLDYKTWGVFYNTKVFEELGLEIPTTATELEEVSKAIEAAGYDVWADWYSDGASVDIQTRPIIWTAGIMNGDTDLFEQLMNGTPITDYPYIQEALDDWARRLQFNRPDALSNSQDQAIELFVSGVCPMMYMGSWAIGDIEAKAAGNPGFSYGFFLCPATEDPADTILQIQVDDAFMVNPNSPNADIAQEFMRYWITEGGLTWTEVSSQPLISGQSSDSLPQVVRDIAAIKQTGEYVGYGQYTMAYTSEYTSAWRRGLTEWAENIITGGSVTSDQQIARIQQLFDDIRALN